jgi:hypothetical protein
MNTGQVVNSSIKDHKIASSDYVGTMKSDSEEILPNKSRRTKASSDKKALMKTIAQEMVNSLIGNEEDGDEQDDAILQSFNNAVAEQGRPKRPSASKPKKKKKRASKTKVEERLPESSENLADLYYARMAGEEYNGGTAGFVNDSFADLALNDPADDDTYSKRSLVSASASEGSNSTKRTAATSSSISVGTNKSGELSVDEIREHVMASIPKEIRDKIPEEMWKQIFGQEGIGNGSHSDSHSGTSARNGMPNDVGSIDDDDISACSDITGFPDAFPAEPVPFSKRQEAAMAGTEISDLTQSATITYDACDIDPTLAPHAPGDEDPFDEEEDSPFSSKPRSPAAKRNKYDKSENLKASLGCSKRPAASSAPTGKRRSIKFSKVEVRYYERIISDNPSVHSGPAIGIGWRFAKGGHVDIDEWELRKGSARKSCDLVLARHERERILKEAGCTPKEISAMIRAALKVQKQRMTTVNNLSAAGMEEAVEAAKKKMAGMLKFGREKNLVKNK